MKLIINYLLNKKFFLNLITPFLSQEKQECIYIARFRAELSMSGIDTSQYTNEELKEGLKEFSSFIKKSGLTVKEVTDAMALAAVEFNKENIS